VTLVVIVPEVVLVLLTGVARLVGVPIGI
jgi:hypothetical protein